MASGRTRTATAMAFRDQRRRPLVLVLLVLLPAYVVFRSIAMTDPIPLPVALPGGEVIASTMRDVHGAVMAGSVIAFVAGLVGVFVMHSALQGDRRLVIAGFRPAEAIGARLAIMATATGIAVSVSALVTALSFSIASWPPFLLSLAVVGLMYAAIGALAGAALDRLAATYLILFLALTDLGIVQNPMFGTPDGAAALLPGYGPARVMVDGAFSTSFHAEGDLLLSLAWLALLSGAVFVVLRRAVAQRS
jgi:hypothetical protein